MRPQLCAVAVLMAAMFACDDANRENDNMNRPDPATPAGVDRRESPAPDDGLGQAAPNGVTPPDGMGADNPPGPNDAPAADNTAVNERDRAMGAKTPLDQGENQADINISAAVRRAVLAQGNLSTNADNVKIITASGVVTLRGVVNNAAEKERIAQIARQTAGVSRVDDQLTIAPNP